MTAVDELAAKMREAYSEHRGDVRPLVPWEQAAPRKKESWRVIAKAAISHMKEPTQ